MGVSNYRARDPQAWAYIDKDDYGNFFCEYCLMWIAGGVHIFNTQHRNGNCCRLGARPPSSDIEADAYMRDADTGAMDYDDAAYEFEGDLNGQSEEEASAGHTTPQLADPVAAGGSMHYRAEDEESDADENGYDDTSAAMVQTLNRTPVGLTSMPLSRWKS